MFRSLTAVAWGGEEVSIHVPSGEGGGRTYREEVPTVLDEGLVLKPESSSPWLSKGKGEVTVEPGRYRFRFSIQIPEGALPAFRVRRFVPRTGSTSSGRRLTAQVRYLVRVRADIRRGPDAVREIEIPVGSRWTPSDIPSARSARWSMQGGPGRPSVQLELDHEEVEAGGSLAGSVTVTSLRDKRIKGVRILLWEREWGRAKGKEVTNSIPIAQTEISPRGGLGGLVAPFTLRVPAAANRSYVGKIFFVRHIVRARVRLAWARDLKVRGEIRVVRRLP